MIYDMASDHEKGNFCIHSTYMNIVRSRIDYHTEYVGAWRGLIPFTRFVKDVILHQRFASACEQFRVEHLAASKDINECIIWDF